MQGSFDGMVNGLVVALIEAILMVGIGASGKDVKSPVLKQLANLGVAIEFSTLVHVDIFVGHGGRRVTEQPSEQPTHGCTLGDASISPFTASLVIDEMDIACFTIQTHELHVTIVILGLLTREHKIHRDALTRQSGGPGGGGASSLPFELARQAGRALVQGFFGWLELGNAISTFVGFLQIIVRAVIETLMPQQALSSSREPVHLQLIPDRGGGVIDGLGVHVIKGRNQQGMGVS